MIQGGGPVLEAEERRTLERREADWFEDRYRRGKAGGSLKGGE